MQLNRFFFLAPLVILSALLVGCGDKDEATEVASATPRSAPGDGSELLDFISADTPYAVANTRRMPRAEAEELVAKYSAVMAAFGSVIDESLAEVMGDQSMPGAQLVAAAFKEITADLTPQGIEANGFRINSYGAFYGLGVLPVIRIELDNEASFRAFVARVEARAGTDLPVYDFSGQSYWRIDVEDASIPMAVVDGQFVVGLVPADSLDSYLPHILQGERPQQSLAQSGKLDQLVNKFGFVGYGSGFVDVEQFTATLFGESEGTSREVWNSLAIPMPEISEICRSEITELVQRFPRIVFGYTEFTAQVMAQSIIVELAPDLAAELVELATAVPGLGVSRGMLAFGYGLDVAKAHTFLRSMADNRAAAPYQCEELQGLNEVANNRDKLNAPLPPFVGNLKGLNLVVSEITLPEGGMGLPTGVRARAVVSVENAPSLYGMAAMMQPALAEITLQPDGVPVALPAGIIPPVVEEPYLAMTDDAISASVGAGESAQLPSLMSAETFDPPPIIAFSYDMGLLAKLSRTSLQMAAATMDESGREALESQLAMMDLYAEMIGAIDARISFTDRGVEMQQVVELK